MELRINALVDYERNPCSKEQSALKRIYFQQDI